MSDFDIIIGRPSLSLPDLVLHGDRQPGWCLMPNFTPPLSLLSESQTAGATWLNGAPVISATFADPVMSGDILPEADDTADLAALIAEMRAAISPLSFPVQVVWKGFEFPIQTGRRGSLTISPIDWRLHVETDAPVFSLSIPCEVPGA